MIFASHTTSCLFQELKIQIFVDVNIYNTTESE